MQVLEVQKLFQHLITASNAANELQGHHRGNTAFLEFKLQSARKGRVKVTQFLINTPQFILELLFIVLILLYGGQFPQPLFFPSPSQVLLQLSKTGMENGCSAWPMEVSAQCPTRDNWHDLPVNWMGFAHITDALVPGHIQHEIREPDCSFTGWIAHTAEVKPAVGQRHWMRKRQTQDNWGSVLVSSQPSEIIKTAILLGKYLLEKRFS